MNGQHPDPELDSTSDEDDYSDDAVTGEELTAALQDVITELSKGLIQDYELYSTADDLVQNDLFFAGISDRPGEFAVYTWFETADPDLHRKFIGTAQQVHALAANPAAIQALADSYMEALDDMDFAEEDDEDDEDEDEDAQFAEYGPAENDDYHTDIFDAEGKTMNDDQGGMEEEVSVTEEELAQSMQSVLTELSNGLKGPQRSEFLTRPDLAQNDWFFAGANVSVTMWPGEDDEDSIRVDIGSEDEVHRIAGDRSAISDIAGTFLEYVEAGQDELVDKLQDVLTQLSEGLKGPDRENFLTKQDSAQNDWFFAGTSFSITMWAAEGEDEMLRIDIGGEEDVHRLAGDREEISTLAADFYDELESAEGMEPTDNRAT